MQRNTELVVRVEQLLRHFVERLVLRALGRGVIADGLAVDWRDLQLRPVRYRHGQPVPVGGNAPLGHPLGLFLLLRPPALPVIREAGRGAGPLDFGYDDALLAAAERSTDFRIF